MMQQINDTNNKDSSVAKKALLFRKDCRVYECGEDFRRHGFECTCVMSFFHFLDELEKGSFDVIVVGALYNDCTLEDVLNVCYEKSPDSYLICSSYIASSVPDWFMERGGDLIIDERCFGFPQKKVLQLFNSPSGLTRRKSVEAINQAVEENKLKFTLACAPIYLGPILVALAICFALFKLTMI